MAKAPAPAAKGGKDGDKSNGGSMGFIIAMVVLTVVGGGGGFLFATQFLQHSTSDKPKAAAAAAPVDPHGAAPADGAHGSGGAAEAEPPPPTGELLPLPPIVTNLLQPAETFIRIEGSIVVEPGYSDGPILAAKVGEDIIALLKTMTLAQLQGSTGLNHLREDINDRVKIRSEQKARELIIHSLVIE
ncbi:MAG: flagellar basal body-associated FliL family protein [Hyphomicrobium sp.]